MFHFNKNLKDTCKLFKLVVFLESILRLEKRPLIFQGTFSSRIEEHLYLKYEGC